MLPVDRRKKIVELIYSQGSVQVAELSERFQVSEETIRRDLDRLEAEDVLKRTYGGAYIDRGLISDVPIWIREEAYLEGKDWIGEKCKDFIQDGDVIMLDSSTTSLHIAKKIKQHKKITVITNSLKVILELSDDEHIQLIDTGGKLRKRSQSFVGKNTLNTLKQYFTDYSFVSCSGIHLTRGITDANEEEAEVRKQMFRQADQKVLIIDYTKLNKTSFALIDDYANLDKVITDKRLPAEWIDAFTQKGVDFDDREKS